MLPGDGAVLLCGMVFFFGLLLPSVHKYNNQAPGAQYRLLDPFIVES